MDNRDSLNYSLAFGDSLFVHHQRIYTYLAGDRGDYDLDPVDQRKKAA